jgi:hypothetical protein
MKKYYIEQINLEKIKLSKLNIYKNYKVRLLLTPYGMIHCKNDMFQKQKLIAGESHVHENIFNKLTIYETNTKWINYTKIDCIPYNHRVIIKNVYEIKIDKYSKTTMVLEYINDKIADLYITSDKNIDDYFFKKDLGLFIKMII